MHMGNDETLISKNVLYIWAFLDGISPTPTFCELFGLQVCFGIGSRDFVYIDFPLYAIDFPSWKLKFRDGI